MKRLVIGLALAGVIAAAGGGAAVAAGNAINLAAHRAIYDLKLEQTRGKRSLEGVRGRIVYDFSGTRCDGYGLQFRQVTQLDTGEGKTAISDLRSTTWEEGAGKLFRFTSQNFLDQKQTEQVDGTAEQARANVLITLKKPTEKKFDLPADVVFPSEHLRRIIAAARAGEKILEVAVFDGSENGEKVYQTLTIIGQPVAADKKPADAAADEPSLAGLTRWPVTISYFEKKTDAGEQKGEQTPIYSINFELYENGISRALVLDYGDFVISGNMTSLVMKNEKACP